MNRGLVISVLVVVLLGVGGFWLVQQGQENSNTPNEEDNLIDPRDLKVGDMVDVFTVESVKVDGEDYEVQLKGEKTVRGRSYVGNAVDGDGELLCFYTYEVSKEPFIPLRNHFTFCVRNISYSEYKSQAERENLRYPLFATVLINDPIVSSTNIDSVSIIKVLEMSNTP